MPALTEALSTHHCRHPLLQLLLHGAARQMRVDGFVAFAFQLHTDVVDGAAGAFAGEGEGAFDGADAAQAAITPAVATGSAVALTARYSAMCSP